MKSDLVNTGINLRLGTVQRYIARGDRFLPPSVLSLFPFESAVKALNKVRHRLISTTSLLLVVASLLRPALLACEETIGKTGLLILFTSPVCTH